MTISNSAFMCRENEVTNAWQRWVG